MADPLDYQPKTAPPPADATPACPACGGAMRRGRVRTHGTLVGFLFVGVSHENLYFEWDDPNNKTLMGTSEVKLADSDHGVLAFRCFDCGTVVVPGRPA